MANLRNLKPSGYLGSAGRQAYRDGVSWAPHHDPAISNAFEDEDELNGAMVRRMAELVPPSYLSWMRTLVSRTLRSHKAVFTHGDLHPKNIIVRRTGAREDGTRTLEIKITDWEISGWYPEYWEFCNATVCGRFRPDWLELVLQIMEIYPNEYVMMHEIQGILFY